MLKAVGVNSLLNAIHINFLKHFHNSTYSLLIRTLDLCVTYFDKYMPLYQNVANKLLKKL